jgi:hypothetical protein
MTEAYDLAARAIAESDSEAERLRKRVLALEAERDAAAAADMARLIMDVRPRAFVTQPSAFTSGDRVPDGRAPVANPVLGDSGGLMAKLSHQRAVVQYGLDAAKARGVMLPRVIVDDANRTIAACRQAEGLMASGFDPWYPNRNWYAGFHPSARFGSLRSNVSERYLSQHGSSADDNVASKNERTLVYRGAWPKEAEVAFQRARKIVRLDQIRIWSPNEDDFKSTPVRMPIDPIMGAFVDIAKGDRRYFLLAQWDLDDDLRALYKAIGVK